MLQESKDKQIWQETKNQKDWLDYHLPDLRHICQEHGLDAPMLLTAGKDGLDALAILELALGFDSEELECVSYETPMNNTVKVLRSFLPHIVEKRQDARERYTNFAKATLLNPFEIWKIRYEDAKDSRFFKMRLAFVGLFKGKRQMLVIIETKKDVVLWNFMHQDAKSLNKHRHGELIYQRIQA